MSEYPKNLVTPTEQSEPEMPLPEKILDPIEPTKKKKPFILIAIIVIVGLILIAIGLLMFMNNGNGLVPGVEPTPTPENGTEPTPTPTEQIVAPERGYRYVAYAKEDPNSNIWVIDTQGGNQKKITDNNDASTYYPQVDWKAFDIVVYTECSHITNVCSIWQTSIYTGQTESVVSADKFVTDAAILAFGISEDGNQVAYIYSVADGRAFVQLQKDGKSSTLKELPPSLGRDGTFDDTVSVEFSPDGRLLLITDPLTQPNTKQDFTTMWIYDTSDGTELFGLGKQNKFASMGIWLSNDTIIYKFDGNLIRKKCRYTR